MKPINIKDLNRAYFKFVMYLILLLVFSIATVFFFFTTSDKEMVLLNARVKETDQLVSIRNDINNNFEFILQRMHQLSEYSKMNAEELNNQNILLNDIQTSNQRIEDKLQSNPYPLKSFELYKKLSNHIATIANIKDSLLTTRFQIESLRSQLDACNRTNRSAITRLSGRFSR